MSGAVPVLTSLAGGTGIPILAGGSGSRWAGPGTKYDMLASVRERTLSLVPGSYIVSAGEPTITETVAVLAAPLVLLGDVYYTRDALAYILNDITPLRFYGREFEIYALRCADRNILCACAGRPKLWDIYYYLRKHDKRRGHLWPSNDPMFYLVPDKLTQDFDYYRQWRAFDARALSCDQ